jgi:hypothetical protein
VRALRTLWRHRDHLVTEAAKLLQMMQKVLVQMNVYLHLAVADIAGVTGERINFSYPSVELSMGCPPRGWRDFYERLPPLANRSRVVFRTPDA